jgi:hypothetical protein
LVWLLVLSQAKVTSEFDVLSTYSTRLCFLQLLTFIRFFYGDERTAEGGPVGNKISGDGHADFYLKLATEENADIPWDATFVKDKGYVKF